MRIHNAEIIGSLKVPKKSTDQAFSLYEEGKIYYNESDDGLYFGSSNRYYKVPGIYTTNSPPTTATSGFPEGTIWIDSSSNQFYVYVGSPSLTAGNIWSSGGGSSGGGSSETSISTYVYNYSDGADYTSGTTTILTLSAEVDDENNLQVCFDGVCQHHNTYSVSGTTITFDAPIPLGTNDIEIINRELFGSATTTPLTRKMNFISSINYIAGTTTQLTLNHDVGSINNLIVTFDGLIQHSTTYSVSGDPSVITFTSPIPLGTSQVEVLYGIPINGTTSTGLDVSDLKKYFLI